MEHTATNVRASVQRPPMWTCVFVNDNYTPMIFVIEVLMDVFHQTREDAEGITLKVHAEGKSAVGSYPKDVAMAKSDQAMATAGWRQYPLQVIPARII